ncbi:UDP-N-acetylmuramoyl-L-alanyl-D-glutamate--2,6-diaminopimelate ligase [Undibacterium arcticum]|uniref:UDP-N-acetylmuramoyl-L-alanyl-D-glutamate--2,6-diaminopimelate ligase n=1 Tax=Undibacterium arcticum TaxID=1762892 RepID=A0ABV7F3D3_9BURK
MTITPTNLNEILDWLREVAPGAQLSSDSRSIAQGDVFLAYPGDSADGRHFIADAIARGAQAVLFDGTDFDWNDDWNVPHLALADLKLAAGHVANAYYGRPDADMYTVAVTGTNGKTSSAQWIGNALSRLEQSTAVIGTLGVSLYQHGESGAHDETGYTTPDAVLLQRKLAALHAAGASALAIEASSIGLDQGRLNGLHVDVAVFTNFTRDHLDYHGDMASYEVAKTRLFDWPGLRYGVVNLDDEMGLRLAHAYQDKLTLIGYTLQDDGEVPNLPGVVILRATDIRSRHAGTEFQLDTPYGSSAVKINMVGRFNVSNVLGVLGVLLAKAVDLHAAVGALEALTPAPGRMQQLGGADAPMIVIDYAHTPDALEKTLAALRQVAQERHGQLWCVFGCGGDRDPGKRPQMGAIAQAADHVVVTSDNPRSENAHQIIEQILAGMTSTPQAIDDRAAAILSAVRHAEKNDVILLAGKGHESSQEVMGKKLSFSDTDHAALALAARATMGRAL